MSIRLVTKLVTLNDLERRADDINQSISLWQRLYPAFEICD